MTAGEARLRPAACLRLDMAQWRHRTRAQVAEWAGHSVAILLKIYAKCIDGQDDIAKRRIEEALGDPGEDASEPGQPDSDDRQD